jgi:gamma-glutamyltranspeptidase / glutathione hydrolase
MVASAHPQVSLAGAAALSSGGNAYDAALAMAGMAAVALPAMCGVGGDAFAVVHDGPRRTWTAYMGSGVGPDGVDVQFARDRGMTALPIDGPLSVAVPGAVDCWIAIHRAGATRGLNELWSLAVAAARDGIAVTRRMHGEAAEEAAKLRRDAVSHTVYLPGGAPPAIGSVLRQPDLARTLETVAASPRAFYQGALAERCVAALRAGGAPFSGDEWAAHATLVDEPVRGSYGGVTLLTTLPPSPGYMVAQQAAMLDGMLRQHDWLGAGAVHLMASAARRAFDDRWQHVGTEGDAWRALLRDDAIAAARASVLGDAAPLRAPMAGGDTTCFVAADAQGTVVSMIQSVAFVWGSGVMVPGTGVLLNNRAGRGFYVDETHPNRVRPRVRPMHTLNVWALADDAGRPLVAGGTPGGDGQVQWNVQLISHLLDHGLSLQAAVEAPRFTVWPGSDADVIGSPPELRCESRLGAATVDALRSRGHNVRVLGDWDGGGGAQLVALDREHGTLRGGSDPRLDGCALAV